MHKSIIDINDSLMILPKPAATIKEEHMHELTLQQHRARIRNLRRAREEVRSYTREMRIHDYLPGQITYYLGDYPAPIIGAMGIGLSVAVLMVLVDRDKK